MRRSLFLFLSFLFFSLASSQSNTPKTDTVWLSTLDLSVMTQGWGQPHLDKSVSEKPLSMAGTVFPQGVGTHAPSRLWINLGGGSSKFLASVGVDDGALNHPGSIDFTIYGDSKKLWKSGIMKSGEPAQSVDIDLTGVGQLLLLVGDAGDGIDYDHADWANARFVVTGTHPRSMKPPEEPAIVLTPKPGPQPRINGAKVFGVRSGSPFSFTIPATGDHPMRFGIEHLPKGLRVDSTSGRITGMLSQRGEYTCTLVARNKAGTARRKLKIVCGDELALTPHMGWNSWYVWENHVTEDIVKAAADAMVSTGMINHGYTYLNIDDCWAVKLGAKDSMLGGETRDAKGKVRPNKRFPDLKGLTDYIHSIGLKAGIYTSPGPTTCAGHVGAYQHEEDDVRQFVDWGFDFLKYDWCSYDGVAKGHTLEELKKPYRLVSAIIAKQKRDVVLNICQYGMGDVWKWGKEVGGNSWRTAGDLGGSFEGIATAIFRDGFDVYSKNNLDNYAGPGGWNDPDYLLLGYLSNWKGQTVPTPLTPNEQYTHVSLWCLVAAPLIFSGDMTRLDEFTLGILTNDEVLEVDQDPLGKAGHRVSKDGEQEVWMKEMEDGSKAVGLFNRGEFTEKVVANWEDLHISGIQRLRDLWRQKDLGFLKAKYVAEVPRHGVVLVRMWPAKK